MNVYFSIYLKQRVIFGNVCFYLFSFSFSYISLYTERKKRVILSLSRSPQNRNCLKFGIFCVFLFFFLIMVRWKIGETCWGRGTFQFIKISMKISTCILYCFVNINSAAALEWQYLCFCYALRCVSSLCCVWFAEIFLNRSVVWMNYWFIPPTKKGRTFPSNGYSATIEEN